MTAAFRISVPVRLRQVEQSGQSTIGPPTLIPRRQTLFVLTGILKSNRERDHDADGLWSNVWRDGLVMISHSEVDAKLIFLPTRLFDGLQPGLQPGENEISYSGKDRRQQSQ